MFSLGLFIKLFIAKIYLSRDHVPQAFRALVPFREPLREVCSVWGPATDWEERGSAATYIPNVIIFL